MNYRVEFIRHLRRRGLSPNTIDRYDVHLRAFEGWLDRDVITASTFEIEAFLTTRRINDRSKYQWISNLSGFYEWCQRTHGTPVSNPTEPIIRPRLRRLLPRPISEGDLELALDLAEGRMYSWIVLGAFAGFRCCEIAWLTVDRLMWHEGLINVFGKGGKERIVEMHPLVAAALKGHRLPSSGVAFRGRDGAALTPRRVSNDIGDFFTDIGVNATAHQLRHRFGTKTYAACKDLRVVQELLGHANPNTTAVYTAFARTDARAAVLALPAPFIAPTDEAA